jgi:hypothetical protein
VVRFLTFVVLALPPAGQTPAFEEASIWPQPWTNEGGQRSQAGGPGWARHGVLSNVAGWEETLFQVIAKAPEGSSPTTEQFRQMLRGFLKERFRLRVRVEDREQPIFRLVRRAMG